MVDGTKISYLMTLLVTMLIVTETVLFYCYYRKQAKETNKKLPKVVTYIFISVFFCSLYSVFIFLLNYEMCYGLEAA